MTRSPSRKRNFIAMSLRCQSLRQQIVQSKKAYNRNKAKKERRNDLRDL